LEVRVPNYLTRKNVKGDRFPVVSSPEELALRRAELVARYEERVRQEAQGRSLAPHRVQGTLAWADDEISEISQTSANPLSEDAEFELERVVEEVKERLDAAV
jgi:hypothetical protein